MRPLMHWFVSLKQRWFACACAIPPGARAAKDSTPSITGMSHLLVEIVILPPWCGCDDVY
jgi:hypothetical protein